MHITDWIVAHLPHRRCPSTEFMYDDMPSQSGYSLPVIYKELNVTRRGDWRDEGQILDFASVAGAGAKVLDLGPGDGWPSLRIAPFVAEVIGIDASRRRVQVCTENAARLGIPNARFGLVGADGTLPCASASLDAVVAASSLEQTPDPAAMLRECARVLVPGGRLRMSYEDLERYRGGEEIVTEVRRLSDGRIRVEVVARDLAGETATMVRLYVGATAQAAAERLQGLTPERLTPSFLKDLAPDLGEVRVCTLRHPSGATWVRMLLEAGFRSAQGTENGGQAAAGAFDRRAAAAAPRTHAELREYLLPLVRAAVGRPAPLERNPWITAIR